MPTVEEILIELSARNDTQSAFSEVDRGMAGVETAAAKLQSAFAASERTSQAASDAFGRLTDASTRLDIAQKLVTTSGDQAAASQRSALTAYRDVERSMREYETATTNAARAQDSLNRASSAFRPPAGAGTGAGAVEQDAAAATAGRKGAGETNLYSALYSNEGIATVGALVAAFKAATVALDVGTIQRKAVAETTADPATLKILQDLVTQEASKPGDRFTQAEISQAAYAPLSTGFTSKADLGNVLDVGLRGASGAGVDPATEVAAITTALHAYALSAKDAQQVADIFNQTVAVGAAQAQDTVAAIGVYGASTAAVGIKFKDAQAVFAQLTLGGVSSGEAAQEVNALAQSLIKPDVGAAQALRIAGVPFGQKNVTAAGLPSIIDQIQAVTQGDPTQIKKLFPNQAAEDLILGVTGKNYESYRTTRGLIDQYSGAVDRSNAIANSGPDAQLDQLKVKFNNDVKAVGDSLLTLVPSVATLANSLQGAATQLGSALGKAGSAFDQFNADLTAWAKDHSLRPTVDAVGGAKDAAGSDIGGFFSGLGGALHQTVNRVASLGGGDTASAASPSAGPLIDLFHPSGTPLSATPPPQPHATPLAPIDNERIRHLGSERQAIAANNAATQAAAIIAAVDQAVDQDAQDRQLAAQRAGLTSYGNPKTPRKAARTQTEQDLRDTLSTDILDQASSTKLFGDEAAIRKVIEASVKSTAYTREYGTLQEAELAAQIDQTLAQRQNTANQQALTRAQRAVQADALNVQDAQRGGNLPAQLAAIEQGRRDQLAQAALTDKGDPGALALDKRRITGVASDASTAAITADAQRSANDNLEAARLQLQAAQQGYDNTQQQVAAAQTLYQATLAADKVQYRTDPAAQANADQAAKLTRDSTDKQALAADAQRRIAELQAERQYDINHGIGTADVNKRLAAERASDASLLHLTKYDLANAAFGDQQAAIPKAAPTFASYPAGQDPGISAGRGGAVFRFGQFAGDSEAQTIALLRQQVEQLQQQLAEERQQSGYQKEIATNTRPGVGSGGLRRAVGGR